MGDVSREVSNDLTFRDSSVGMTQNSEVQERMENEMGKNVRFVEEEANLPQQPPVIPERGDRTMPRGTRRMHRADLETDEITSIPPERGNAF